MDFEKPKQEELANLLVEKHKNFIKDYRREYDILDRIAVLKEKREQLLYWIDDSKGNPEAHQKHLSAKENTDKEVLKLQDELKGMYASKSKRFGPSDTDPKARHKWLKAQITANEEAENFWKNKIVEIQSSGTVKEKAAEVAKHAAAVAAQRKAKLVKKTHKKMPKAGKHRKKTVKDKVEKAVEAPVEKT
jgi:hypothetical protein